MKTSQAFIHQHLQSLNSPNQWILTTRNNQTIVTNSYSSDQFYPYRLVPQHHRKQCRDFQIRQQYSLPHTPKIILISKTNKSQQMLLLAQKGQFSLDKIIAFLHSNRKSQLQFVLQIFIIAEMLMKKYGYFQFTPGMIKACKGPTLLLWINQNQASNHPQFPIGPIYPINLQKTQRQLGKSPHNPMQVMLQSLVKIIGSKIMNNIILEIIKQQKQQLTFQYIKKKLQKNIKDQCIISQCAISTSSAEKNRRFTEEKKKKVPEFILNRGSVKGDKKQKKYISESFNKKSAVTYSHNQFCNKIFKETGIKRIIISKANQQQQQKNCQQKFLLSLLSKNSKVDIKQTLQNKTSRNEQRNMHLQANQQPIQKKQQKIIVRQSGKSISTSSGQYFSINSSGKKFFQGTFSTDEETPNTNSRVNKNQKSLYSVFSRKRQVQKKEGSFFKEFAPLQVNVSRIIQQNYQDIPIQSQSQTNRTPRSPSIVQALQNSGNISQKSITGPGSQFFKDVDLILHSGAISPKMSDNNFQCQFREILND